VEAIRKEIAVGTEMLRKAERKHKEETTSNVMRAKARKLRNRKKRTREREAEARREGITVQQLIFRKAKEVQKIRDAAAIQSSPVHGGSGRYGQHDSYDPYSRW